jgi:hypothetical protein
MEKTKLKKKNYNIKLHFLKIFSVRAVWGAKNWLIHITVQQALVKR